ncbi:hypothetical protein EDB19DRAFT_1829034 [Suillus lakei]|nr:hypothetical protein EDB19DRAFT_1829034 [Suillus lakei]
MSAMLTTIKDSTNQVVQPRAVSCGTLTECRGDDLANAKWLQYMPDLRYIESNELRGTAHTDFSFSTLLSSFLAKNGNIVRPCSTSVSFLSEELVHTRVLSCTVPSTLLSSVLVLARALGGVENKDVSPIRGQTVLLRAPWVKFWRTMTEVDGTYTYTIPRSNGDELCGGTRVPNDCAHGYLVPRPEISEDIRPIMIEPGCGLCPARKGGIRLEVEWLGAPTRGKVHVVHNYGHSGYGFLSSWGCPF